MALKLPEHVESVLEESYKQRLKKPIRSIKLPCSEFHKWKDPVVVQVTEARDQKITCRICGRSHYLVYSKIQDHLKWER